jgi:copper chaperone CopZ
MESAGVVLVSDKLDKVVSAIPSTLNATAIAIIVASVGAVLLSTLSLLRLNLGATESEASETVVETVIPARRMHCDACARKISRSLSGIDGVRKVVPDAVRKEVLVAYEPSQVSEDRLREQLTELGFR